jgi:hypothetical protein
MTERGGVEGGELEVWRCGVRGSMAVTTVEEEGNQVVEMDEEAFPVSVYAITIANGKLDK